MGIITERGESCGACDILIAASDNNRGDVVCRLPDKGVCGWQAVQLYARARDHDAREQDDDHDPRAERAGCNGSHEHKQLPACASGELAAAFEACPALQLLHLGLIISPVDSPCCCFGWHCSWPSSPGSAHHSSSARAGQWRQLPRHDLHKRHCTCTLSLPLLSKPAQVPRELTHTARAGARHGVRAQVRSGQAAGVHPRLLLDKAAALAALAEPLARGAHTWTAALAWPVCTNRCKIRCIWG